jgi:hypothetical protein
MHIFQINFIFLINIAIKIEEMQINYNNKKEHTKRSTIAKFGRKML